MQKKVALIYHPSEEHNLKIITREENGVLSNRELRKKNCNSSKFEALGGRKNERMIPTQIQS